MLLDDEYINLGDYSNMTIEDWQKLGDEEAQVRAVYADDVHLACVLMVVTDDDACTDLIKRLRCIIQEKNFKARGLIKYCGQRVKPKRRMKILPVNVIKSLYVLLDIGF